MNWGEAASHLSTTGQTALAGHSVALVLAFRARRLADRGNERASLVAASASAVFVLMALVVADLGSAETLIWALGYQGDSPIPNELRVQPDILSARADLRLSLVAALSPLLLLARSFRLAWRHSGKTRGGLRPLARLLLWMVPTIGVAGLCAYCETRLLLPVRELDETSARVVQVNLDARSSSLALACDELAALGVQPGSPASETPEYQELAGRCLVLARRFDGDSQCAEEFRPGPIRWRAAFPYELEQRRRSARDFVFPDPWTQGTFLSAHWYRPYDLQGSSQFDFAVAKCQGRSHDEYLADEKGGELMLFDPDDSATSILEGARGRWSPEQICCMHAALWGLEARDLGPMRVVTFPPRRRFPIVVSGGHEP